MVKLAEGDSVWAADNGKLFEAKIIKFTEAGKLRKYFIHYKGWSGRFDVWVDEQNLVPLNDLSGKAKLQDSFLGIKSPSKGKKRKDADGLQIEDASTAQKSSSSPGPSSQKCVKVEDAIVVRKRRRELAEKDLIDEHCGLDGEYVIHVPLPLSIKTQLVDEWTLITGPQKRLIRLPRPFTVANIFEEFLEEKKKKTTPEVYDMYDDILDGFQNYFDKALPLILLYRQEREQFDVIMSCLGDDFTPSTFYGGEHLSRLFVKLQRMFTGIFVDQAEKNQILAKLTEFLKWVDKSKDRFIAMDYIPATEAIAQVRAINVVEFKRARALKADYLETQCKKKVKIEEVILLSPTTGRPIRAHAGKNKYSAV